MEEPERNLVKLIVPRDEARQRIEDQCSQLQGIFSGKPKSRVELDEQYVKFDGWQAYTYEMLRRLFSTDELASEFASIPKPKITSRMGLSDVRDELLGYAKRKNYQLALTLGRLDLYAESQPDLAMDVRTNAINIVEHYATRFDLFASQLATRQRGREPFKILDEYDLQDVFHALLRLSFDDVRPEEWTPSYAGGSSKIDFLVKAQQIVVELKMTNAKLREKEVANQLIIDIERYQSHTDCRSIVCFIYDPSHFIRNPVGLENDLTRPRDNIDVIVIVSSK